MTAIKTELVSADEVAELCDVSVQTIRRWVAAGYFPQGIRMGRRVLRWNRETILAWIQAGELKAQHEQAERAHV